MGSPLSTTDRAALRVALEQRRRQLDAQLAAHQGGTSRVEHAREVLQQDGDDAPQRDAERELDLALGDLELSELGAVSAALRRVDEPGFGLCVDCGGAIALARLRLEPWALRCVGCEAAREAAARASRGFSM